MTEATTLPTFDNKAPRELTLARVAVRAGGALLGRLAPGAAAAWFERLFCTPPRGRADEKTRDILAAGRPFTVPHGSLRLAVRSWGAGPTVMLAHGWGGQSGQLAGFVAPLVAAGYRVLAFDAPAHGDSDGRRTTLVEMARALVAVAASQGRLHAVVGHSMAGPVIAYGTRIGLEADRLVFVAPPADITEMSRSIARALGINDDVRGRMQRRLEDRLGIPWSHLDLAEIAAPQQAGLLIFHDRLDKEVPWVHGAYARTWPGARLVTTVGLGHRRILDDEAVIRASVAFIDGGDGLAAANSAGLGDDGQPAGAAREDRP
jgi:pimeloyl-ACP methyl ester carboxylesterase